MGGGGVYGGQQKKLAPKGGGGGHKKISPQILSKSEPTILINVIHTQQKVCIEIF